MKGILLAVAIYLIVIFGTIGGYLVTYQNNQYQADIGKEWLWRARATNDLDDMAAYLERSLSYLDNYSGNPCWLYPTPDTNYDYIKTNIREVIENCNQWNDTQDSFSYQQAVRNLQETIIEIAEHVDLANGWLTSPSVWYWILWSLWWWIWLPLIGLAFVVEW
jgi:hypothetical protein